MKTFLENLADLSMEYEDETGKSVFFGFYKIEGEISKVSICIIISPNEVGSPPTTHYVENALNESEALEQIQAFFAKALGK